MALTLRNGQINITNPLKVSELFPNIGDWNIEKIFHMSELKLHRSFFTKSTLFCWMERTTITIFVRWWILDPWWPRQSMNNPIIVLLSLRSGVSVLRPSQLERDETSSPQLYYASPLTFILGDCITLSMAGERLRVKIRDIWWAGRGILWRMTVFLLLPGRGHGDTRLNHVKSVKCVRGENRIQTLVNDWPSDVNTQAAIYCFYFKIAFPGGFSVWDPRSLLTPGPSVHRV